MKKLMLSVVLFLLATALAACKLELPPHPMSASVEQFNQGAPKKKWNLTEQQVELLGQWFSQHQTGWSTSYVTYVPAVLVRVVHSGGVQSSINVSSGGFVIVNAGDRQFTQKFEDPDARTLLAIVEKNGD